MHPLRQLGDVVAHRKEFVTIDDFREYKRCRVQLRAQGIVLRDRVPGADIKTKTQQVCRAGDLLVAEIDAKLGGVGIVPDELDGAIVSSHYFLYSIDETQLHRQYLGYYLRTPEFLDQVKAQGSTNYAAIRPEHVLRYTIPLPPLPEQRRLAVMVHGFQERISDVHQLARAAALQTGVLKCALLVEELGPLGVTGRLGDVLAAPPRNGWSAKCDGAAGGLAVLSLASVTGFRYRAVAAKRTSLEAPRDTYLWLRPGDLLVTRSNTRELVGHAAIYDGNPSPCIFPDLMMRLDLRPDRADTRFVWYWLQLPATRAFLGEKAKGTNPSMVKISQEAVMAIPFPSLVRLEDQVGIRERLDRLQPTFDSVTANRAQAMTELGAIRSALVRRLLVDPCTPPVDWPLGT